MEATTEQVLRALGAQDGYAIARVLLERDETFTRLAHAARLPKPVARDRLESLRMLGLVQQRGGSQGEWHLEHWGETLGVLDAARVLAVALNERRDVAQREDDARLEALRRRGGPDAAPRRGRKRKAQ